MKAWSFPLLMAVVAASLALSAHAQQNPGLSVQPAGRSLATPEKMPADQPGDLTPLGRTVSANMSPAALEESFFAPAMRGEAWAQTKLGKIYAATPDDESRRRQGIDLLRKAAEQNDAEAVYLLATMTAAGLGGVQSDGSAFEQMKRAADLGSSDAQFALGTMYFKGTGTARDEAAAFDSFRRAAEGGNREAMFAAGRILLSKKDPESQAEGLTLMNRAIENGHIEATLMLATAYGRGSLGMPKDEAKAEALLKPAAERGNADCQMVLASLYKFGDSFADRRALADEWLRRAADQGQPKALEILRSQEK